MSTATATIDTIRTRLHEKLSGVLPEFEIDLKAEVAEEVERLKRETGAVVLGHNYMEPALFHSVCDHTGDSLELARLAVEATGDPIVFCGVRFMAETAKILNPARTVLLPAKEAGCSLASSITAEDVRRLRDAYPGIPIVAYINTYAEVKAEVDVCCTSGNAKKVIEALGSDRVIFLPDEFLAGNIARETGVKIMFPEVEDVRSGSLPVLNGTKMVGWKGRCEVHEQFTVADIESARRQFPDVTVLAHPECSPEVVDASDVSGSTSQMIRYVRENGGKRILLLTECAMGDNIASHVGGGAEVLRLCSVRCPHMAEITLENVRDSLLEFRERIELDEALRVRAKRSIDRMLEIG